MGWSRAVKKQVYARSVGNSGKSSNIITVSTSELKPEFKRRQLLKSNNRLSI